MRNSTDLQQLFAGQKASSCLANPSPRMSFSRGYRPSGSVPKRCAFALISILSLVVLFGSCMYIWSVMHLQSPLQDILGSDIQIRVQIEDHQSLQKSSENAVQGISDEPITSGSSGHTIISSSTQVCTKETAMLKVFMYDMPPEFHFGMIIGFPSGQNWPLNASQAPRYPGGLNQQHSPEYWLTLDLLTSTMPDRKNPCTAMRVLNKKEADIVFVPFFSSLSYNRFSRLEGHDKNVELQEKVVQYLMNQEAWRRSGGRNHVIVMHHPNSLHASREKLSAAMFIVSDFGRYSPQVANIGKDIVAPYKHMIPTYKEDSSTYERRHILLFFQGAIVRKDGGLVRQQLYELLKDEPGVHFATGNTQRDGIRSATLGMHSSRFCLHLAGDTPSSNRLFDAIVSHCVPVIISDDIELPYEDILDYSEFSLFVRSSDALRKGFVIKLLTSVSKLEWTKMWKRLKQVDHMFEYQHPTQPGDAVNMIWESIARKLPSIRQSLHKRKRYSRSRFTG